MMAPMASPQVERAESHALAASVYTLLSGFTMLMSEETAGEPEPSRRAPRGARKLRRALADALDFRAAMPMLKTRLADGAVASVPVDAIIDMVLTIRPRFEAWDGSWPVPEDCGRAARGFFELSGWPA